MRVTEEDNLVRVRVCDDGAATTTHPASGFGLPGMTERASLLGGVLHAGSRPEGGWIVDATLPKGGVRTTPRAANQNAAES